MGYRGSKSKIYQYPQPKDIFVKEQRVDGSWGLLKYNKSLRCILMGFERSYQIKILTKQLNKLYYSTINQIKLDPWFLTGFTDAEGCFSISIRFDPRLKNNWRILPVFIIKLHPKDHKLLDLIKNNNFSYLNIINKNCIRYRTSIMFN